MKFEWDEEKNRTNIRKHGFDFADVEEIFRGLLLVRPDTREDYGETRWQGIGLLGDCPVVVVFTEREPDIIRAISLRKAKKHEQAAFEARLKDRLEAD
ncbi:MAG: BrnT family toxin [Terriglobia bacterium]